MTKREFLDAVFALAPNEANAIMDAFDEYVDSNEPHWIPVTERLPEIGGEILFCDIDGDIYVGHRAIGHWWSVDDKVKNVTAWMPLPEPYKGVTE